MRWTRTAGAPYDDVMALTDAASARPDIDAEHTAMMGAPSAAYMAILLTSSPTASSRSSPNASPSNLAAFVSTPDNPSLPGRVHCDPVEPAEHTASSRRTSTRAGSTGSRGATPLPASGAPPDRRHNQRRLTNLLVDKRASRGRTARPDLACRGMSSLNYRT